MKILLTKQISIKEMKNLKQVNKKTKEANANETDKGRQKVKSFSSKDKKS